jgi:hypothetical protein
MKVCKRCENTRLDSQYRARIRKGKVWVNPICRFCEADTARNYWRQTHGLTPCPCCGTIKRRPVAALRD